MLKNHLKTAWRTMVKDKTYATINILGLTIGLAACMLVFTVVIDELSYDKFWSRADDLYKVNTLDPVYGKWAHSPSGLGPVLAEQFPEMENFTNMNVAELRLKIDNANDDGVSMRVIQADTTAREMLDFQVVSGQLSPYVAGQLNLAITESFRDTYFKGEDPVGKTVYDVPTWQKEPQVYTITAVIKDLPENTHLRAQGVVLNRPEKHTLYPTGDGSFSNMYFLLKPGTDGQAFSEKVNAWYADFLEEGVKVPAFEFQPIRNVYLHSDFDGQLTVKSSHRSVYIFGAVGLLLMLIACINFINLSTARAMKRLKETGVRKILGAQRGQLVSQFLTESLLFFFAGTVLALGLYTLTLPVVERFMGHGLTHSILANARLFAVALAAIFMISLVTGAYPAWLLSGFKPSNTLRGKLFHAGALSAGSLRKALVVVQFAIAVGMVVALLVVRQQVDYLAEKDIGYEKENLLHIGRRNWDEKGEVFKTELKKLPGIESVSLAGWDLSGAGQGSFMNKTEDPVNEGREIQVNFIIADFDFVNTLGFELVRGRQLDRGFGTDIYNMQARWGMEKEELEAYANSRSSLITESTAKRLRIEDTGIPIPKLGYPAVGIIKDFHRASLHQALDPTFILAEENPNYAYMFIRTTPGMEQRAQQSLVKLWKKFYPNRLLDAQWVTDILDKQYEAEQKQQTLFSFFSGLMLFLSAMGVFGLIVHAAQQRVKEIGIRKVLGASVSGIVGLLSKDFVKLVLIAVVIATPIAWWAMNRWLEDFAYRIEIQWWMFALAGLVAVAIALATVSWQAIRAAVANPVDSLRDE
ncbi:FtsX-like permease family protein [Parapedobacter sp. DT-150]|uniref:ABC transporter permease n=1 Tax=Parapedobacter sp. DT-150 TaxID=3396162 RepID=UPI003F1C01C4